LISLLLSNHYMRLRCNPAKGRLTDHHVSLAQEGVLRRDQWYPLPNGSDVYLLV
jgi:hypothetical protein